MTKYIAVSNRRGGVGKTTITMMLAYGLAVTGRQRVLLIDLDAQASTSMVMMGHKRWREAREANRTNASLLTHLVGDDKIVASEYIAKGIGDVTLPGGGAPSLDIMPSSHDLDDREALLMIAHQARFHKISDAFDHMQYAHGADHPLRRWPVRSGRHRLRAGPLAAGVGRAAHRRPGAGALHSRSHRRGQRRLACAPPEGDGGGTEYYTVPNRVSGQDSRAQGIIAAVSGKYSPFGVQVPATQPLATALDYRDQPGTFASKFGTAAQYVNALTDTVLKIINKPIMVAAQ